MAMREVLAREALRFHIAAMTDPFPIADTFDAVLDDIWRRLGRGAADRRSAFHTPSVGSVDSAGQVQQRIMVLRKTDRTAATLRFHTDIRSAKAGQAKAAVVGVLGYDPGAKIQVRADGMAAILTEGADVDAAWAATSPSGRRSYLTTLAPGTISDTPTSGLPAAIETRMPEPEETVAGRANFGLLVVTLDRLEWLHLAHDGHRRAAFARVGDDWAGQWLIP
jgi:pyridoxamine 5'-phosphate oxidase